MPEKSSGKEQKAIVLDADALNLLAEENGKALEEKCIPREQRAELPF